MSLILSGSDGLSDVDGTAATPAIRGTDANTGIFFPAADTIAFSEGGAEAMRLDSSGDVNLYNAKSFKAYNSANTRFGSLFTDGNGTNLASHNGSGEPILLNSPTGYIALSTNGSERARIDSSGNLLVGTTSALGGKISVVFDGSAGNGIRVKTSYATTGSQFIDFLNSGGVQIGYISQNGASTVNYSTSSDYRLKNTIAPMTGALAKVALLKPSTYKWNADNSNGQGFIAHELAEVVPDCVSGAKDAVETYTDEDGNEATRPVYQGIDTSFLVATLTAAIQEQQALITQLQADVAALKAV